MDLAVVASLCLARPDDPGATLAWGQLNLAPAIVLPWAAMIAWHARALRRAGSPPAAVSAALCAHALLAVALVSPLCRWAAVLASAHMVQHILIAVVAPALLAWAGLAGDGRGRLAPATVAYSAAIWGWHVPALYDAALRDPFAHVAMIASLLGTGAWFWGAVLAGRGRQLAALPMLLLMLIQTGMLGALLTFAPSPLYPLVAAGALALGRAPLADQQLAGLLMWVPMAGVFLLAALWHVAGLLDHHAARLRSRSA